MQYSLKDHMEKRSDERPSQTLPSNTVGVHFILELFDCPSEKLNDAAFVTTALREAVQAAGCTLIKEVSHRFEEQGVTALGLLAESHISIHTWPERGYAAADLFTCGDTTAPREACQRLIAAFEPGRYSLRCVARGE